MDNEFVQARSVADGKEIWTTRLGNVGPCPNNPGARSTPTIEGDLLYAFSSDGDLACLKIADGTIVWRRSLRKDFSGKPGTWAYAESPLVDGNVVVCAPGGKVATIVALDKLTGKTVWQTALPEADDAAYASAIILEIGGVRQYVELLQKGVVGVDAKTGKFLWRYGKIGPNDPAHIATPVSRDGFVYFSLAESGGAQFKVTAANGKFTVEHIYAKLNAPSKLGGFVLVGDYLYGTKAAGLKCIEFTTGTEKWQNRCVGPASLFFADNRLYLHGENGEMALVEPTPEGYREHGRFKPSGQPERGDSAAWAYPVVANGRLYVRDLGVLWCYYISAAKGKSSRVSPTYGLNHPSAIHPPKYPPEALAAKQEGTVLVLIVIDATGKVLDAKLNTSCGAKALDDEALATIRRWTYTPATRDGQTVIAEIIQPVHFTIPKPNRE